MKQTNESRPHAANIAPIAHAKHAPPASYANATNPTERRQIRAAVVGRYESMAVEISQLGRLGLLVALESYDGTGDFERLARDHR